jgi:hypothetical protein
VRNKYQRKDRKSNHKFEAVRGQELLVRVPLPLTDVWAEMQTQVVQHPPFLDHHLCLLQRAKKISPFKHSSRSFPLKLSQ